MKAYPEYKYSGIEWLGQIPTHWEIKKLKYIFYNLDYLRQPISSDLRERNNPIFDYYGASGVIDKIDYYNVDDEVLLIGEDGANLVMRNLPLIYKAKGKFWVNNHAHILKPKVGQDYHYMAFLLESGDYSLYITGSAQPKLSQENLNNYPIPVPPIEEQKAIARYLDDVCAKIDALVNEKQTHVNELRAYRTSLITETVTHGLNPDVSLRPSGIDWLGNIPEHWKTSKLKYIGDARNGLTYSPEDICDESNGVLVLRSSNIQNDSLYFENNVYVSKKIDDLMMQEGDILICSRNGSAYLIGKCAIIPKDVEATFGAFMMRYRSKINKKFTLYLIRTTLAQYRELFSTSTINQLTNAMIGNMRVALPPLSEQKEIAEFLDAKTAKIDEAIGELETQLKDLADYKQSVISEAVTGKVDVRDWKPED